MKLAILEVSRCDPQALRPWSDDPDCVTLAILSPGLGQWRREPVPLSKYEAVAQRQFAVYKPLFEAGSQDLGPRLKDAEVGLMAAADFSLFIETRYQLVLLADLERMCRQNVIERVEYVTDADGARYLDAARVFAQCRGLTFRHVALGMQSRGVARAIWQGLNSAAARVSIHGPAYLSYARAELRRRRHRRHNNAKIGAATGASAGGAQSVRAAMMVYHAKSWVHLLPIRRALVEAGHKVLLVSPRLECDRALDAAGVEYVACHGALPKPRLRRAVADYVSRMSWHDPDDELDALVRPRGPLRKLVVDRALSACDIYADLADRLPALFAKHRINVGLGTDSGSVAGRTFFRTAQSMGIETVFIQHGSVFALVGAREYMLQTHRLLWGQASCDSLSRCGVYRPERIVCHGSAFHEERFGSISSEDSAGDRESAATVLITFGVPGGYVTEDAFRRAADAVFQAASRFRSVRFVVKPHPGDSGRVWRELQSGCDMANLEIRSKGDTYELMRRCAVLLTMFSTTGSEAICMGKPVVSVNPDGRASGEDYLLAGAAYTVRDPVELAEVLAMLLESAPNHDRLAATRSRFRESFLHRQDRSAATRTVDFLENLLQQSVAEPARGR